MSTGGYNRDRDFDPTTAATRLDYWTRMQSTWWAVETFRGLNRDAPKLPHEVRVMNAMEALFRAQINFARAQIDAVGPSSEATS